MEIGASLRFLKILIRSLSAAALFLIVSVPLTAGASGTNPSFFFGPITPNAATSDYSLQLNANTGSNAVAAVDAWLKLPSGVSFVSGNATGSSFETEVTPAGTTNGYIHLVRVSTGKNGISGSDVAVETLTLTSALGTPKPTINTALSKIVRLSDSSDVLYRPSTDVKEKSPVQKTSTYALMAFLVVALIALLGYQLLHRKTSHIS